MSGSFQNVHVRVNDHSTGKPTPVSICFQDARGHYYAPFGRVVDFPIGPDEDVGGKYLRGGNRFFAIPGGCEISLPVGPLTVEIRKGPEYIPLVESIHLPWGKLALRFTIQRMMDLRQQGWFSGDSHAFFLTPHEALLEAAATDVAVVNLLASLQVRHSENCGTYQYFSNIAAFSGQKPALETVDAMVAVNTFNRHETLGELALLHCHRAVYPLTFGGNEPDDWNLADWCEQCHRKRGLVVATRFLANRQWEKGEILADAILGLVDVIDVAALGFADFSGFQPWYDLLDCGLKIPLSGGSGKKDNQKPLGHIRTYAKLHGGETLTYTNWIEAVRGGRTFVTNGPLLDLAVNGHGMGSTVEVQTHQDSLNISCSMQCFDQVDRLELVMNGKVIASTGISKEGGIYTGKLKATIPAGSGGWLVVRCQGIPSLGDCPGAHSSPIYVRIHGQHPHPKKETLQKFKLALENGLAWIGKHCNFKTREQHDRMAKIYEDAIKKLGEVNSLE